VIIVIQRRINVKSVIVGFMGSALILTRENVNVNSVGHYLIVRFVKKTFTLKVKNVKSVQIVETMEVVLVVSVFVKQDG
jgi:hypothetical protein